MKELILEAFSLSQSTNLYVKTKILKARLDPKVYSYFGLMVIL